MRRAGWKKTVGGDFDRIDLTNVAGSDWLTLEMRVGNDVERVRMTLRGDEAVRAALSRSRRGQDGFISYLRYRGRHG